MAIIAMNPKKPRWHVIITDQKEVPSEKKFTFQYIMLDLVAEANLRDNIIKVKGMGEDREEKYSIGAQDREILMTCIRGWKNLIDDENKEIEFSKVNIEYIPPKVREEMIRVIRGDDPLSLQRKKE